MKIILVFMVLSGRWFEPVYVIRFPTEQACADEKSKYRDDWRSNIKAMCVPEITK